MYSSRVTQTGFHFLTSEQKVRRLNGQTGYSVSLSRTPLKKATSAGGSDRGRRHPQSHDSLSTSAMGLKCDPYFVQGVSKALLKPAVLIGLLWSAGKTHFLLPEKFLQLFKCRLRDMVHFLGKM